MNTQTIINQSNAIDIVTSDPVLMKRALKLLYTEEPDPCRFLAEPFTLAELHSVHESVLGEPIKRDAFRRHMQQLLVPTGETTEGRIGKPAMLFRHP